MTIGISENFRDRACMGYSQRVCAGRVIADSCGPGKAWISASLAEIRSVRSGRSNLAPKGQRLPRKFASPPWHNFVNMNIVTQYPAECGKNFLYLRCSLEGTLHIFDESVKLLSSDRNLANSNTRRKGNLHSSLFWLDVRSLHSYHRVWGIVYFVSGFARTSIRMSFGPTLSALR